MGDELVGKTFNQLYVNSLTDQRTSYGKLLYSCTCLLCGRTVLATRANLLRGEIKNCGRHHPYANIAGKVFNKVRAICPVEDEEKKKGHDSSKLWECRCLICGRTCYRTYGELKYGKNLSCGCLNGERIKTLTQNKTNLALVNSYKIKPPSDNTSGYVGVSFDRTRGKWSAKITFQGVIYRLGRFVEKRDAIQARKDAERRLHSDFFGMYQLEHPEEWEKIKNNAQKKAELIKAKHPKKNDKAN